MHILTAADYSLPHNETTRCHQEEYALIIGLIVASICVLLIILAVSVNIGLVLKHQYRQ